MKTKMKKILVAGLAMASFCLMGCEPSEDAEGPVNITVTDADGNKYPTMKIGQQIWMAKNLNVDIEGSLCYRNNPAYCEELGRLYSWDAAQRACPSGWHLPSKEEFNSFLEAVKLRVEESVNAKKLNAEPLKDGESKFYNHLRDSSWENGLNTFGFSVVPTGFYDSENNKFRGLDYFISYWTSTEGKYHVSAFAQSFHNDKVKIEKIHKTYFHPVRCLRD